MLRILLADDDSSIRLALGEALRAAGHEVTAVPDGAAAKARLTETIFDVIVSDIHMPKLDGLGLFKHAREVAPDTDVILMTAHGSVADAVKALKDGASDYLTKPFDTDELLVRLRHREERRRLQNELTSARRELVRTKSTIIGHSPITQRLLQRIDTISSSEAPVLITGESGTGKELVARRIHDLGPRRDKPFVAINCAAFPESLLDAELFGHEKGAFTGALRNREGRFKMASGGTLFLDEIAEIPPTAQVKLLRVLQEGVIEPLGSDRGVAVDVRIMSATHQNLKKNIAESKFREDLYYRLKVLDVHLPPLRERRGDLPALVEHFLSLASSHPPALSPAAWAALSEYLFPGNIRELQHAIASAVVMSRGGEIDLVHLPDDIAGQRTSAPAPSASRATEEIRPLATALREYEREYIQRTLENAGGKKAKAAEALGISRKNLWEKLRGFGISDAEDDGS